MSDEPSDGGALPVLSSQQQGLSVQRNSLVKRGLELAASGGRLTRARTELEIAHRRLDEAERASLDPATWHVFVRHWRDTYRHGLLAVANYLEMDPGEGSVELARRLLQQSKGFDEYLPNQVANSEHFAAMIDVDREKARQDWERWVTDTRVAQTLNFANLKTLVEDVVALIEPPESGTIVHVRLPHSDGESKGNTVTLLRWLKGVGERTDRHESLVELSLAVLTNAERAAGVELPTAKLDFVYLSAAAGTLSAIFVKEGETVPIDTVLASIETR
jgi:hypothetical protein